MQTSTSTTPTHGVQNARQCWECLRRRLECDRHQPVCNKCQVAGIVCPGYADQKPLTWLAPGKVVSRPRKKKAAAERRNGCSPAGGASKAKPNLKQPRELVTMKHAARKVTHIIELSDETVEMFECAYYYNTNVYPDLVETQLTPSPFIVPFLAFHDLTRSLRHLCVTHAISHRILQLPGDTDRNIALDLSSRLQHHRSQALRALNDEMQIKEELCSDATISSILLLMFSDVQQMVSGNWRAHVTGLTSVFEMRGGIGTLVTAAHMRVVVLTFILCVVMGNSTSPAANQVTTNAQRDVLGLFTELYEETHFPVFPCPGPLMAEIFYINDLRAEVAAISPLSDFTTLANEAAVVLGRIASFSPDEWAAPKDPYPEDWLVLAQVCHSSVLLYCAWSLRDVLGPLSDLALAHRRQLFGSIRTAFESPRLGRCIMWPVIVAGVLAVEGTEEERESVNTQLLQISRSLGSYAPLAGRMMLKKFWFSGKTGWDDCFDEPRVFLG